MHSLIFGHSATDKSSSAPQPKPQQQRQPQQQQGLAGMSNSTRRNDMDTQNRSSTRLHHVRPNYLTN